MQNNDISSAISQASQSQRSLDSINRKYAAAQSKISIQRNEIARLTKSLEKVTKQKMELIEELRWLKR